MTPDVADRDLNRSMIDPARRAHLMERVAAAQAREHPTVQQGLSGQAYAGTFADGMRQYQLERDWWRRLEAETNGKTIYVDDQMIADMTNEQYDAAFDANGRPKDHVFYHPTRSIRLDSGIDPHSGRELFNR